MKKLILTIIIVLFSNFLICGCEEPKSSENDILEFSIILSDRTLQGEISENEISVEVPFGTDISKLSVDAVIPEMAAINPELPCEIDFTKQVEFTIIAEDGTTNIYTVKINVLPNSQKDILSFDFDGTDCEEIEIGENTIKAVFKYGTDISALIPQISVSENATVDYEENQVLDFNSSVVFIVTAEDKSTKNYEVEVSIAPNTEKEILGFLIDVPGSRVSIDGEIISVTVPYGSSLKEITPEIEVSDMAEINPPGKEKQDFTNPVVYTVTAQDGSSKDYTVKFSIAPKPKSPDNKITKFALEVRNFYNTDIYEGVIEGDQITVALPLGTNVKSLTVRYTLSSDKARINLVNYSAHDFTNPVTFTVTAEDGSTRRYTVKTAVREPVKHVQGEKAIKAEFEKMGFVFNGDSAKYTGRDFDVFLTFSEGVLQMATKYWGREVEWIFVQGMTIVMGREVADNHVFYIDRALSIPNSVHKSDYMQAFTQDDALIVHIYLK